MNLAIDIGNTRIKAAVFEGGQLVETFKSRDADDAFIESVFNAYPSVDRAIMVSCRRDDGAVEKAVRGRVGQFIRFDSTTPVPIKNLYATPETLGHDRLAAAVGANVIYPQSNVMIVDFGTAITIDVVNEQGEFVGGNISPGVVTRFRSLHEFTDRLPLRELTEDVSLLAATSHGAIESGVINGIVYEMEGYVERLSERYDRLKIIFTGGDGIFFAKRLKNTIFATYDLVVYGLNRILEYNAD